MTIQLMKDILLTVCTICAVFIIAAIGSSIVFLIVKWMFPDKEEKEKKKGGEK